MVSRASRGFWFALCVSALAVGCRDYGLLVIVSAPEDDPGSAGAAGDDNQHEEAPEPGGMGGAAGETTDPGVSGRDHGAGAGGEAGSGVSTALGLGTVVIEASSERPCSGTLQTNAWVLTAGRCIPESVSPDDVQVTLGGASSPLRESIPGREVVRFGLKARELALLRLARPFSIDGKTSGYVRPYYGGAPDDLYHMRLLCLNVGATSAAGEGGELGTAHLIAYTPDVGPFGDPQGTTLWLDGTDAENEPARSMLASDGAGCFAEANSIFYQVGVQLGPSQTDGEEPSSASSLTDSATRHWLLNSMLGKELVPGIQPAKGMNVVSSEATQGEVDIVWINAEGKLVGTRLSDREEVIELGGPEGVALIAQRPAIAASLDYTLVVAYGEDHELWYRMWSDLPSEWQIVPTAVSATSPATLVNVGGEIQLIALGAGGELRRSRFDGAVWHGWDDQGGVCSGTPSASSRRADQLDLVVRAPDNSLFMRTFVSGQGLPWLASPSYAASPSDPLIVSSEGQKVDLFHEDLNGNLRVSWRHWHWLNEWLDPGVPVGSYLAGVSKAPGTYDLFLSDGSELIHLWWPR